MPALPGLDPGLEEEEEGEGRGRRMRGANGRNTVM
jgi:hypothetical protein